MIFRCDVVISPVGDRKIGVSGVYRLLGVALRPAVSLVDFALN